MDHPDYRDELRFHKQSARIDTGSKVKRSFSTGDIRQREHFHDQANDHDPRELQ